MTGAILVIGYGNVLRGDDGLGWHAADRLARDPRFDGATILRVHQLTPELALDISRADLVILIDARLGPAPGSVAVGRVEAGDGASTAWSHQLGPASLMSLAEALYDRVPDVHIVSVGIGSTDLGETLTPEVEAALPRVVVAVRGIIGSPSAGPDVGRPSGPMAGSRRA